MLIEEVCLQLSCFLKASEEQGDIRFWDVAFYHLVKSMELGKIMEPLSQGSPSPVLEGRCPAEFSFNPN